MNPLRTPPHAPTRVRVAREHPIPGTDRTFTEFIPCHTMYGGHDGETHWWAIRTVTDEWIRPTDTITHDPMPSDYALSRYTASAVTA
ncbi:hypothetical protein L1080_004490 [Rhodococcus sp. MSC1_016]|jgi:hypothetical protein|uniref:hypothetical protein n=1 Tax=Rhodococcus sp. MSC1_016 TaxID=2909266 RepID=UPI00202E7412|nr:hypothetical protein [Rhodococcus sp. MSC1_016]